MSQIALSSKTTIIPAYASLQLAITGNFFYCTAATAPFKVSLDGAEDLDIDAGLNITLPSPQEYRFLVFRNPTANANTVSYFTGRGRVGVATPVIKVKNVETYAKGSGQIVIPADGTYVSFTGLDGVKVRKQFMVACQGVGTSIFICDAAQNGLAWVQYPGTWTAEVGGQLWLRTGNIGVGSVAFVGEIFYA
jgi:hypothetical protein